MYSISSSTDGHLIKLAMAYGAPAETSRLLPSVAMAVSGKMYG